MTRENVVWLSPSATTFSCLCELCLDIARDGGLSFLDAVRAASVRGEVAPETPVAVALCPAGHQVVLRRVERPPSLDRPDARQLQLV
jgi:hypothetical protein